MKKQSLKPNIDHDRLFKNLITLLFVEFLELFAPHIAAAIDKDSIEFIDKEVFSELMPGKENEADVLAKVRIADEEGFILIHAENQAKPEADFPARMFDYFKKFDTKFALPIYPIAVFSFDAPKRPEPFVYSRVVFGLEVIRYQFQPIQLNLMKWQDFVGNPNPVAVALMARMNVKPEDYMTVRRGFFDLFATGKLDRKQLRTIDEFMSTYLKLTTEQYQQYQEEMKVAMSPQNVELYSEIITESDAIAFEKGIIQGLRDAEIRITLRQLEGKLGTLGETLRQRIMALSEDKLEDLSIALLNFQTVDELQSWLDASTGNAA